MGLFCGKFPHKLPHFLLIFRCSTESFQNLTVSAEWETLKTDDGKSLLQHFYEDKARWSYTFQNCAILTRLVAIQNAIKNTKKKVIITERSLLTDRFVFAEMLNDSGDLNAMEWALYRKWFDNFAVNLPIKAVIHVTTNVGTSANRIVSRAREGESSIPTEYLDALDAQHYKWLDNTDMPVLRLSTDDGIDVQTNIDKIRDFVHGPHILNDAKRVIKESTVFTKQAPSPFTMNNQVIPVETL